MVRGVSLESALARREPREVFVNPRNVESPRRPGDTLLLFSLVVPLAAWSLIAILQVPRTERRLFQAAPFLLSLGLLKAVHDAPVGEALSYIGLALPVIVGMNLYSRVRLRKSNASAGRKANTPFREEAPRRQRKARKQSAKPDDDFGRRAVNQWREAAERNHSRPQARLEAPGADAQPGAAAGTHAPPSAAAPTFAALRSGEVPFHATIRAAELRTPDGKLLIGAGELSATLHVSQTDHRRPDGETQSEIELTLRFADADGREWEVKSFLSLSAFGDALEDPERRRALSAGGAFSRMADAPAAYADALRTRPLVQDKTFLLDSQTEFELELGPDTVSLYLSQQEPAFDVALFEDRLLVQARGLSACVPGPKKPVLANGELVLRPSRAWQAVPAFAWLEPRELLLCFARPEYHYSSRDELAAFTRPERRAARVARLTGATREPLGNVVEARDSA